MQALAYRSQAEIPESGLIEASFGFFGVAFRVCTNVPLVLNLLDRLYGSYASSPTPAADRFVLTDTSVATNRWHLAGLGAETAFESIQAALQELEYQVCQRAIDTASGLIILHGATVLGQKGSAFIAGCSEAGKTTLALALAARGYAVLSDDIALLDPRSGALRPVPRCFHLDSRSRRLLRSAGLRLPEPARRTGFIVPADVNSNEATEIRVRHVICLDSKRAKKPALVAAAQATVVAKLSQEAGWATLPAAEAITALARMAGDAYCWTLCNGRLQPTTAVVSALLDTV